MILFDCLSITGPVLEAQLDREYAEPRTDEVRADVSGVQREAKPPPALHARRPVVEVLGSTEHRA